MTERIIFCSLIMSTRSTNPRKEAEDKSKKTLDVASVGQLLEQCNTSSYEGKSNPKEGNAKSSVV